MNTDLTPWFPVSIEPYHIGVYEIEINSYRNYSYWNGYYWLLTACSVESCYANIKCEKSEQMYQKNAKVFWRGLTKQQSYSKDFEYYIPQNTGFTGGSSWFDTNQLKPNYKTLAEAEAINSFHSKDFGVEEGVYHRVVHVVKTETYYPMEVS